MQFIVTRCCAFSASKYKRTIARHSRTSLVQLRELRMVAFSLATRLFLYRCMAKSHSSWLPALMALQ